MQTNDYYSRPRIAPKPRKKDPYEEVGPPAILPKTSQTNMDLKEKRLSLSPAAPTRSPSSHTFQLPLPSLPPSSPRPVTTSGPPPLPPRQSSLQSNIYSSPKSHRSPISKPSDCDLPLYNVPRPHSNSLPPSYDSLPPVINSTVPNEIEVTVAEPTTNTPKLMPKNVSQSVSQSKSMSLNTLAENHQNDFPLRVEVTAGYFGESERDTFSEGDVLNIHFAKLVTVAVVDCGGKEIKIPLNSTIQFSPLYDPNKNFKEATQGFTFKSIKEIIATSPAMPLLVNARKSHKISNPAHSVEKGELLKIVEVKQGKFGGQSLICLAINGSKTKRLSESCQGEFNTNPDNLKLHLPEITTHLPLPQKAVPFVDHNMLDDRGSLFVETGIVTILRIEKEKTIVATLLLDEKITSTYGIEKPVMFEIPADLEILEVQVVIEEESDYEKLYVDTKEMMESFDPTNKSNQVRIGQSNSLYYDDIGKDSSGIELIASEAIYQDVSSLLARKNTRKPQTSDGHYCYTDRRSVMTSVSMDSFDPTRKEIIHTKNESLNGSTISLVKSDSSTEVRIITMPF